MVNHTAAHLAFRNRLITLAICTTGAVAISATANGYARAAGSFITDGFRVGMELLASGFGTSGNNGYKVVTAVTATDLYIVGGGAVEGAGTRTLAVGLPEYRAFENVPFDIATLAGRLYVSESWVPATKTLLSAPARNGILETTGLYTVEWCGLAGSDAMPNHDAANAIEALFAPGTPISIGGGVTVRVRDDVGPMPRQSVPVAGWSVKPITIPWRAYTNNTIAA